MLRHGRIAEAVQRNITGGEQACHKLPLSGAVVCLNHQRAPALAQLGIDLLLLTGFVRYVAAKIVFAVEKRLQASNAEELA
jgi:hypothetical protein